MAFNFFKRKKPEVVEPDKPDNRIDADLLLMQKKLGEIVQVSVAAQLVKKAEASAYLSFQRNEDGLKSIDALREWLDILEGYITKEEVEG